MTDETFTEPVWLDFTRPIDGEAKSVTPREVLMSAARMQRDGMSLPKIRKELGLLPSEDIDNRTLQRALDMGHKLLAQAIARGEEPEESRVKMTDDDDDVVLFGPDGRRL